MDKKLEQIASEERFWGDINACPDKDEAIGTALYHIGCHIQELCVYIHTLETRIVKLEAHNDQDARAFR